MKRFTNASVGMMTLMAICMCSGCAHQLTVTNLDRYQTGTANSFNRPITIGVAPQDGIHGPTDQKLGAAIAGQLGAYGAKVVMPYTASAQNVDVVAAIGVDSTYQGSGWNFLINWPGFLIEI